MAAEQQNLKFSVIIPAYNYGDRIPISLESVLNQSGGDYEILVIDDGSTDKTPEVLEDYGRRYPDRFRALIQVNQGPAAVRNRGIEASSGEYLLFLDADDRLLPDALKIFRKNLKKLGPVDMIFGSHCSIHPDGRIRKHTAKPLSRDRERNFLRYIRNSFGISNGATIMSRRVFQKIRYPEHIRNREDIPVFAQALALYDCASFSEPVLEIMKHEESLRSNLSLIMETGTHIVDVLFDPGILPSPLMKYRDEFHACQCLALFRALYVAGLYSDAVNYYHKSIKASPKLILKWAALRKYLRVRIKGMG